MENIKLFKIENDEKGIWYFTNTNRAAKYIGTSKSNVDLVLKGICNKCKGWTIEEVDGSNIIYKYIDPVR